MHLIYVSLHVSPVNNTNPSRHFMLSVTCQESITSAAAFCWTAWCYQACTVGPCGGERSWLLRPLAGAVPPVLQAAQRSCPCPPMCSAAVLLAQCGAALPRAPRIGSSCDPHSHLCASIKSKLQSRKAQKIFLPIDRCVEHVSWWYFSVAWEEISQRSLVLWRSLIKRGICEQCP